MDTIVELEGGFCIKITRVNKDVTIIRFVISQDHLGHISIPEGFSLSKKSGEKVSSYEETFHVTWSSNYELKNGEKTVFIVE